jgi:1-acyl-sn-glycerol-3-phosphate acyltransferase
MLCLVGGIICGVLGILCLSYACFASTNSWWQTLSHWGFGCVGCVLIACFLRHTAFYFGLQIIAAYVCENPKTAGKLWTQYSRWWINTLFTVQIHNETTYTQPVIFLINHIAKARPFDEFCLALIDQPNLRIVALPHKPGSYPDIILKSSQYIPAKHSNGFSGFTENCEKALQDGNSILVFPEGKHTEKQLHWTQLSQFQSGVFELALKTKSLIVPLILEGFNCDSGCIKGFGQGGQPLRLHYLDPIDPRNFDSALKLKHIVRYQMNQKLQHIFLKSLPEEKANALRKYI